MHSLVCLKKKKKIWINKLFVDRNEYFVASLSKINDAFQSIRIEIFFFVSLMFARFVCFFIGPDINIVTDNKNIWTSQRSKILHTSPAGGISFIYKRRKAPAENAEKKKKIGRSEMLPGKDILILKIIFPVQLLVPEPAKVIKLEFRLRCEAPAPQVSRQPHFVRFIPVWLRFSGDHET